MQWLVAFKQNYGRYALLLIALLFLVNAGGTGRRLRRDDLPIHTFASPIAVVHLPARFLPRSGSLTANIIGSKALWVQQVRYRLNESDWQPVGNGGRRVPSPLFIIELPPEMLKQGENQLMLAAIPYLGQPYTITHTFAYDSAPPQLPRVVDWATADLDVGDGVWERFEWEGQWRVRPKPGYEGYDRLLLVTGAFSGGRRIETDLIYRGTVNARDFGFGLLPLWGGRPDDETVSPKRGWNFSLVWYWSRYKGVGNEFSYRYGNESPRWINAYRDLALIPNQRYRIVVEVWPEIDQQGHHSYYQQRLKWWPADQPEPEAWLVLNDQAGVSLPAGDYAVALLAYYSQVDYGPVTITTLPASPQPEQADQDNHLLVSGLVSYRPPPPDLAVVTNQPPSPPWPRLFHLRTRLRNLLQALQLYTTAAPVMPLAQPTPPTSTSLSTGSVPVFPGAEGFGTETWGGRGGQVIAVTTLADSGPGSLRAALEATGPRIVVFRVAGTILLQTGITISEPYLTLAGQTAPGDGITLRNAPANPDAPLTIATHDVVIRHIRARPGPSVTPASNLDALRITKGYNVVIDHVSLSWATDEVFSTWNDVRDVTVQWSIIAEGLNDSTHSEGKHSKGMLLGSRGGGRFSIHHNLLAHNAERNPLINTTDVVDVVNNLIYNHGHAAMVVGRYGSTPINFVGNYAKHGPHTRLNRLYSLRYYPEATSLPPSLYVSGNIGLGRPLDTLDDSLVLYPNDHIYMVSGPHPTAPITTVSATQAYQQVLAGAGATHPARDAVDLRLLTEVAAGTGQIVNHPAEVGGWPVLAAGSPPPDHDQDGMPDAWEIQFGLNPAQPADGSLDADQDGYTNVEEFLNGTHPMMRGN